MRVRGWIPVGAFLLWAAPLLPAQQPTPLGRPVAEFEEPFSRVSGLRELADGRVVVSDQRDKVVQLIDLQRQTARRISREGSGPGEYALPTSLFALPNDRSLLVDLPNRRFLLINPDGTPGETISPPSLNTGGPVQIGGLMNPRGVDAQGRLYFQEPGFRMDGPAPDSVAVLRWTPGQTRVDTAAWVKGPPTTMTTTPAGAGGGGGGGMRFTMGTSVVWAPQEAWAVAGNGRVARVQPEPYRVVWYDANRRGTAGPSVPYSPIRVTDADKRAYLEQQAANPPTIVMMGGGGGASVQRPQMPEPTFAETKPAFSGTSAVLASPEGEVWVLRTRPASDHTPVYDVFDASGRLARKVSLARGSRVVGFGRNSIYVVRTDEDDLEYLQKFMRP
ncbi:MAG: hypothetical protein ABR602_06760 [Gemmatimonadales bacterium]